MEARSSFRNTILIISSGFLVTGEFVSVVHNPEKNHSKFSECFPSTKFFISIEEFSTNLYSDVNRLAFLFFRF